MPKVKRSRKPPPDGWELIEPTLDELDAKMREDFPFIGWGKVPGLPRGMKWPVLVCAEEGLKHYIVYIKSDNADVVTITCTPCFEHDVTWTIPLSDILTKKNLMGTLRCYNADTEWAVVEKPYAGSQPHNTPGDSGDAPHNSGDALRDSGDTSRDSGDAHGDSGDTSRDSGDAQGDSGGTSRDSGDAQGDSGDTSRDSGDALGDSDDTSQDSDDALGDSGDTSRDSGDAHGDSGDTSRDSGDAQGDSGGTSRDSGDAQGDSGDTSRDSGDALGDSDDTSQDSDDALGDSGDTSRDSGDALGHSGDTSRDSGDALVDSDDTSRVSGDALGHSGDTSRDSGDALGGSGDTSRDSGDPLGDSGDTSQDSDDALGDSGDKSRDSGYALGHSGDTSRDSGDALGDSGDTSQDSGDTLRDSGKHTDQRLAKPYAGSQPHNTPDHSGNTPRNSGNTPRSSANSPGRFGDLCDPDIGMIYDIAGDLGLIDIFNDEGERDFGVDFDVDIIPCSDDEERNSDIILNNENSSVKLVANDDMSSQLSQLHDSHDNSDDSLPPKKYSELDENDDCNMKKKVVAGDAPSLKRRFQDSDDDGLVLLKKSVLPPSQIIRDINVPAIYIRKIIKSGQTRSGKGKVTQRVQNSVHACVFCGLMVQHIPTHVKGKHSKESKVKELKENEKLGNALADMLRAKGDHLHNQKVKDEQKGELLLFRRPTEEFDHKNYGPCPKCFDWMLLTSLPKHQKSCPAYKQTDMDRPRKRELLMQTNIIQKKYPVQPSSMLQNTYKIMVADAVCEIAQGDRLIVLLGESWLRRNIDNIVKRNYYASSHMRHCAKLLINLREAEAENETTSSKKMWDYLRPAFFDNVVEAALGTAVPNIDDEEELKSPSNAIKIKYDIMRMTLCKLSVSLKEIDREGGSAEYKQAFIDGKLEAESFMQLMKNEWGEKVTRLARKLLAERKVGSVERLPKPDDIQKLGRYLVTELNALDLSESEVTWTRYRHVGKLTMARLLMYNKRRSGELEGITLKSFLKKKGIADIDTGLMGDLSQTEEYLLKYQDLIETRGKVSDIRAIMDLVECGIIILTNLKEHQWLIIPTKKGKTVPVLIPKETVAALNFLADANVRKAAGVRENNTFLFPNLGSSVQRAYDSMKMVCSDCGLQAPERITSVNMRKYMATLAQVLNLKDNELDWVCRHMGHNKTVHLSHYRATSPFIERVFLGKILLMQDLNVQAQFIGKSLDNVDFNDILDIRTDDRDQQPIEEPSTSQECEQSNQRTNQNEVEEDADDYQPNDTDSEPDFDVYTFEEASVKPKKIKAKRQKWSESEEEEIKILFAEHFRTLVTPGKEECLKAIKKSREANGSLQHRHWHIIVKKLSSVLMKMRKK